MRILALELPFSLQMDLIDLCSMSVSNFSLLPDYITGPGKSLLLQICFGFPSQVSTWRLGREKNEGMAGLLCGHADAEACDVFTCSAADSVPLSYSPTLKSQGMGNIVCFVAWSRRWW